MIQIASRIRKYISDLFDFLFNQSIVPHDPKKIVSGTYYESDTEFDKFSSVLVPEKDFYFSGKWTLFNEGKKVTFNHEYLLNNLNDILGHEEQTFLVIPLRNKMTIYCFNRTTLIKVF